VGGASCTQLKLGANLMVRKREVSGLIPPNDKGQRYHRPPAKPEACRRWSGSKPLGPSERLLRIRSRWVLRAFGAGLSSTIGGRHGTSFTPGDAPLPGASHCSPLPIPTGAPISGPGCIPGIVKLWEPPRQSRGSPVHLAFAMRKDLILGSIGISFAEMNTGTPLPPDAEKVLVEESIKYLAGIAEKYWAGARGKPGRQGMCIRLSGNTCRGTQDAMRK